MRNKKYKAKVKLSGKDVYPREVVFEFETHINPETKQFPVHICNILKKLIPEREFEAEAYLKIGKESFQYKLTAKHSIKAQVVQASSSNIPTGSSAGRNVDSVRESLRKRLEELRRVS